MVTIRLVGGPSAGKELRQEQARNGDYISVQDPLGLAPVPPRDYTQGLDPMETVEQTVTVYRVSAFYSSEELLFATPDGLHHPLGAEILRELWRGYRDGKALEEKTRFKIEL